MDSIPHWTTDTVVTECHTFCSTLLKAFSDLVDDDAVYNTFAGLMHARARYYNSRREHYSLPSVLSIAETIREDKRRKNAARVIQRALWRCVQRRYQLELLDELYKPGGIGAMRAQQRFEDAIKMF